MKWDQIVNCAWHKPGITIVHVSTGKPIPVELIERAPDCKEKRLLAESHGVCDPCKKIAFPSLFKAPLAESIVR